MTCPHTMDDDIDILGDSPEDDDTVSADDVYSDDPESTEDSEDLPDTQPLTDDDDFRREYCREPRHYLGAPLFRTLSTLSSAVVTSGTSTSMSQLPTPSLTSTPIIHTIQ